MSVRPIGLALLSLFAAAGGPAVQPTAGQRLTRAGGDSVAINPARYLGREKAQGTIAVGRRADLVLLEADPLADIRNTRRIAGVIVRGQLLTKADPERMLAARKRASGL